MRVCRALSRLPEAARGGCVAIGNFDGVHLGHRAVIARAGELACGLRAPLGVLTFEPHPREIVDPGQAPPRLTGFARKAELMRALGVAYLHVLRFNRQWMQVEPEAFVEQVLVRELAVRAVVVGEDFHFGRRRRGNAALLKEQAARFGFTVARVAKLLVDGEPCSSTRIRQLIARGEVAQARRLLRDPYEIRGGVVSGDRRGRELGYPTANIRPCGRRLLLPAHGIYAVRAAVREASGWRFHPAVASLGVRPTFGGGDLRLEVHLLDGDHDLYGRRMRVQFLERLREERHFENIEDLRREMERDCLRARSIHRREGNSETLIRA